MTVFLDCHLLALYIFAGSVPTDLFIVTSHLLPAPSLNSSLPMPRYRFSQWHQTERRCVGNFDRHWGMVAWGHGTGSLASSIPLPLTSCVTPGPNIHWGLAAITKVICKLKIMCLWLTFFFPPSSFLARLPPVVSCSFSGLRLTWGRTFQARLLL